MTDEELFQEITIRLAARNLAERAAFENAVLRALGVTDTAPAHDGKTGIQRLLEDMGEQ